MTYLQKLEQAISQIEYCEGVTINCGSDNSQCDLVNALALLKSVKAAYVAKQETSEV